MDDETRFHALFLETYPAVTRYAHNRGHKGTEAEDLVAATYEVAWRKLTDVPNGEWAVPWLLAVARNVSRNTVRKAQREQLFVEALVEPSEIATGGSLDEAVVAREELLRGLLALTELDRELILLVAWDGLEPAQAGEVLGLGAGAARSRLHRARNKLAALLGDSARLSKPVAEQSEAAVATPSSRHTTS